MVAEYIALDENTLSILEFDQVLDYPPDACIGGIFRSPGQRLVEEVIADLDVGGDVAGGGRRRASKQNILGGGFQTVIDQLQRPRRAPGYRGLRISATRVEIR